MRNENQSSDSGLENFEQAGLDDSDFRTKQDKSALLLWVYCLYIYITLTSLTYIYVG